MGTFDTRACRMIDARGTASRREDRRMHKGARATGMGRVAAFALDYVVIAAYIGVLTGVGIGVRAALRRPLAPPRTDAEKMGGHAMAFLALTVPVALYFALSEASRAGATLGKRALGLRVVALEGGRVSPGRSLARSAIKLAPWEVAHTALWQTPGQPFVSPPAAANVAGYILALGAAALYGGALFVGDRRTPYDHIAGTRVVSARGPFADLPANGQERT